MKKGKQEEGSLQLEYIPVGKKVNIIREFLKAIPPQFTPSNRMGYIFLILFIVVIVVGVANAILPALDFSFDLTSGEVKEFELNIDVGLPFKFFGTDELGKIRIFAKEFFIDFIIWLLIAYIIDVAINFILSIKLGPTKEELKRRPQEVQIQKRSLSEKAADKILQKAGATQKKPQTTSQPQQNNQTAQTNTSKGIQAQKK